MRLGKVKISYEYVVDLDNESMVEQAKDALFEDISNSIKYDELGQIITTEETPNLSENDIPEFLLEEYEDQFEDDIDDMEQDEILRTQG